MKINDLCRRVWDGRANLRASEPDVSLDRWTVVVNSTDYDMLLIEFRDLPLWRAQHRRVLNTDAGVLTVFSLPLVPDRSLKQGEIRFRIEVEIDALQQPGVTSIQPLPGSEARS